MRSDSSRVSSEDPGILESHLKIIITDEALYQSRELREPLRQIAITYLGIKREDRHPDRFIISLARDINGTIVRLKLGDDIKGSAAIGDERNTNLMRSAMTHKIEAVAKGKAIKRGLVWAIALTLIMFIAERLLFIAFMGSFDIGVGLTIAVLVGPIGFYVRYITYNPVNRIG